MKAVERIHGDKTPDYAIQELGNLNAKYSLITRIDLMTYSFGIVLQI